MMIKIPGVLDLEQLAKARQILDTAEWVDGKVTAGHQSAKTKDNQQIPEGSPAARELGEMILGALGGNPLFMAAALPKTVFPPLFNRYAGGQSFGIHVDNAIRQFSGQPQRIRTDFSATLLFAQPDEYDGVCQPIFLPQFLREWMDGEPLFRRDQSLIENLIDEIERADEGLCQNLRANFNKPPVVAEAIRVSEELRKLGTELKNTSG